MPNDNDVNRVSESKNSEIINRFGLSTQEVKSLATDIGLNPGTVNLPWAPYLLISFTSKLGKPLQRQDFENDLREIVHEENSLAQKNSDWAEFAQQNQLMAGSIPITNPSVWFLGKRRWITATWHSAWEVHLHFGFINSTNRKDTHLELARDTKNWLDKIAGSVKRNWWNSTAIVGEVKISYYDTGIKLRPRQSFFQTLTNKESAIAAAGICIPCFGFLIKNYQPGAPLKSLVPNLIVAFVVLVLSTTITSAIRHFFVLPTFSWGVDQLEE